MRLRVRRANFLCMNVCKLVDKNGGDVDAARTRSPTPAPEIANLPLISSVIFERLLSLGALHVTTTTTLHYPSAFSPTHDTTFTLATCGNRPVVMVTLLKACVRE